MKKFLLVLIISTLLIGSAYAANLGDFKVDDKLYNSTFNNTDCKVYFDNAKASGVGIFKYLDTVDDENDDAIDGIIMNDGNDYLVADDDYQINKNSDNTANFTDSDHGTYGVVEVVEFDNEKFVIVFWTKNSADTGKLMTQLTEFNKNNNLTPVAF